jgi:hypothetical protein
MTFPQFLISLAISIALAIVVILIAAKLGY